MRLFSRRFLDNIRSRPGGDLTMVGDPWVFSFVFGQLGLAALAVLGLRWYVRRKIKNRREY
jgi:flagellar biogenesis protein FliO